MDVVQWLRESAEVTARAGSDLNQELHLGLSCGYRTLTAAPTAGSQTRSGLEPTQRGMGGSQLLPLPLLQMLSPGVVSSGRQTGRGCDLLGDCPHPVALALPGVSPMHPRT